MNLSAEGVDELFELISSIDTHLASIDRSMKDISLALKQIAEALEKKGCESRE